MTFSDKQMVHFLWIYVTDKCFIVGRWRRTKFDHAENDLRYFT